ncbi:MAG: DUF1800 domain-containing protein [Betaproteobacteria bacterium]
MATKEQPSGLPGFERLRSAAATLAAFLILTLGSTAAHAQSAQDLVGFWWKPTESGWGLTLQQQGASTFAVWFTYDAQGTAIWYTLTCSFAGNTCAGDLYTGSGTPLLQITGSANLVASKVGTGSIAVTGTNRLSLGYTIGSVTQTKTNLEPQNFASAEQVPSCSLQALAGTNPRAGLTNYTDHWWGGPNASGWGLQISHQGNTVFAGWYSYNPQGTATWLTAQGTQDANNARRFTGTLYQVNPGIPFSTINGPVAPSSVIPAGSFELNFSDGERGTFTWSIPVPGQGFIVRPLAIERFAVAGGALNVCTVAKPTVVSAGDASRFLAQATFGPRMADIDAVSTSGYAAWIEGQFAKPQSFHLPAVTAYLNTLPAESQRGQTAFQWSMWKNFATGDDALRQRLAFALSEIYVVSLNSNIAFNYPRGPANYLDTLGTHAFGNFRNLIEAVTYSPMMGLYLSHLRNQKENAATGSVPDENYAREVMQLLTIGLYELNPDGTQKLDASGKPIETYGNTDVSSLGKVFTGLSWAGPDTANNRFSGGGNPIDADKEIKPMQAYSQFHSTSQKQFLGVTIPATTVADTNGDVRMALDRLFNHPNVGPFIGRQLIQRLVSSNPSPDYVSRVAAAFNNNGSGVRGDMKAVIRAILLDPEARLAPVATATRGKIREPIVRLVHWMRAFNARSADGRFLLGTTSDPATQLGQSPMYAPSVFNFFRPGYIPPNSRIGGAGLVAPEMQITNETSMAGYLNYTRGVVNAGIGTRTNGVLDIEADYAAELALANNADLLVDRVNLLLTGGYLSSATRNLIRDAVASVAIGATNPNADSRNRVNLAIFLTMATPEYLFQN